MKERQYRGIVWSQINARDWTILAYLKSDQGGPGLGTLPHRGLVIQQQVSFWV
ncbi:MAG: hypothetical protein ACOYOE_06190 [Chlorobium sp.]